MSNQDPDNIPTQERKAAPIALVFGLGILIAIGTFFYVSSRSDDVEDIERSVATDPATGEPVPTEAADPAPATN